MLTYNARNYNSDEVDFIHNYYERLVLQEIMQQSSRVQVGDREFMADVACVALNHLPPRYIRHDVDMTFFMSPQDMQETEHKIMNAVAMALIYVESRELASNTEPQPQNVTINEASPTITDESLKDETEHAKNKKSSAAKKNRK